MRTELEQLHQKLKTTTIYVTHDQVEAMTLGDKIAVMKDGVIQQYAPPQETYDSPANQFVAGFIGSPAMNFLPATASRLNGSYVLSGTGFSLRLSAEQAATTLPEQVVMGVRPEDLDGPSEATENAIKTRVSVKEQLGHSLLVYGDVDGTQIVASLDPHRKVEIDDEIQLTVNLKTLHVFHPETHETLV